MAGEIGGDVAPLFQIVDLGVILRENSVMLLLLLCFHVDKGVTGTRHQNLRSTLVEWVVRDLEVTNSALNASLAPDTCLSDKLLTIPIPKEHLIIRLSCECHNHFLILMTESTCDELLRFVGIDVLDLLGERLLFLLASDVEDRELAFVTRSASLTDGDVLLALGKGHMSNSLRVIRTCNNN